MDVRGDADEVVMSPDRSKPSKGAPKWCGGYLEVCRLPKGHDGPHRSERNIFIAGIAALRLSTAVYAPNNDPMVAQRHLDDLIRRARALKPE
jgi:hypothetical protein